MFPIAVLPKPCTRDSTPGGAANVWLWEAGIGFLWEPGIFMLTE